jgi:hypothetical protein
LILTSDDARKNDYTANFGGTITMGLIKEIRVHNVSTTQAAQVIVMAAS